MDHIVRDQIPIEIRLKLEENLIYQGVCVKFNQYIFILINYCEEKKEFDGITVFRYDDIEGYLEFEEHEVKEIKRFNIDEYTSCIAFEKINDFSSCLCEASKIGLIAFFTQNRSDDYFVGKLTSLSDEYANFRLIDKKANWTRYKKIKVKNINYFSFDTRYERALIAKAK